MAKSLIFKLRHYPKFPNKALSGLLHKSYNTSKKPIKTYLIVFAISCLFFTTNAHAACTSPTGADGQYKWNAGSNNFDICIGTTWVLFYNIAISGNPTCSIPGQIDFDNTNSQYMMCNGTNWRHLCSVDASYTSCGGAPVSHTTPGYYTYTVPANCPGIIIETYGAGGGGSNDRGASSGGGGGKENTSSHKGGGGGHGATFTTSLTAGDVLDIYVGGGGVASNSDNGTNGGAYSGGTQPVTQRGVQTSANTTFWTSQTSGFGSTTISAIAYNGSNLLAIVGASGKLATSSNGTTWTIRASAATAFGAGTITINTIAYGNSLWVAAGNSGNLATSADGTTWTSQTSNFGTTAVRDVAHDGTGLWVAVGDNGTMTTSTDGTTWTTRTSSFGTTAIRSVAYGGGNWVAVGASGKLATSTDGVNWTQQTSSFGATTINDVAYNGSSLWVAVGNTGTMATSTNTVTWNTATSGFGSDNIYSVAYGNSQWIAGGINGELRVSPNGSTWTKKYTAFSTQSDINSVVYDSGNSQWVTAGETTAGGSYVGGVAGADRNTANYALSLYGGGGGGGSDGGRGAGAIYGGSGGQGDDAAGGCGSSTYGLSCSGSMGGGGGGYGNSVTLGSTGGDAASGGPGNGGNEGSAGGNGKVVITPYTGPCKIDTGCAYKDREIEYSGNKFKWCRDGVWVIVAE